MAQTPENPFVYGEIVPASAFVGRQVEQHRLMTDLASGQKVFLISPRRYGKSSLIRQTFAALGRRKVVTLEFTEHGPILSQGAKDARGRARGYALRFVGSEPGTAV